MHVFMEVFPFQMFQMCESDEVWLRYMCNELHVRIHILFQHMQFGLGLVVVVVVVVEWRRFSNHSNSCREKMAP